MSEETTNDKPLVTLGVKTAAKTSPTEPTFTKEQFLASKQFTGVETDVLSVILDAEKTYTLAQAKAELQAFLEKGAK